MTCQDWRACTPEEGTALVTREVDAWRQDLSWDVRATWHVVEPARRSGHLPGFVVRDDEGRLVGWTACTVVDRTWHVFAFDAPDETVAGLLVEAIGLGAAHAQTTRIVFCVRARGGALRRALARHGYRADTYRYLSKTLTEADVPGEPLVPWRGHETAMAGLCQRAYRRTPGVRAFAIDDTPEAWAEYVRSLIETPGCGQFAPELSGVIAERGRLAAAVMVTRLGPGTVHIAQLAVDPASQRRGFARRLVTAVAARAREDRATVVTLLVAAANGPAVRLYETAGFTDRATFVVATGQPSLSTSLALEMGGASTRR